MGFCKMNLDGKKRRTILCSNIRRKLERITVVCTRAHKPMYRVSEKKMCNEKVLDGRALIIITVLNLFLSPRLLQFVTL